MKKVFLMAAFAMISGLACAQEVDFGLKGGMNISNIKGDVDFNSKVGFNIGGFAEIKLTDKFSVQPEILYSVQGGKLEELGVDAKTRLAYINVPVMAKYYVIPKLSLEAGPQIGFLTSAKVKTEVLGNKVNESIKDNVKGVDFGLNIGAAYDFTENIFAGVRYNFGLSNINDVTDSVDMRNGVLSLSVGYKF